VFPLSSQGTERDPRPVEPAGAVAAAFDSHSLVLIADVHGVRELADAIIDVAGHPDFPKKAQSIVIEAGNALYQDTLDRYIAGEDVPLADLRLVWRNHTCSALGPMDSSNVERLLAAVRKRNANLPPGQRLRVLAGDPPIDWKQVGSRADVSKWLAQRDLHYAGIVESQVLERGHKALLIIGGAHVDRGPLAGKDSRRGLMLQILEDKYPGKTFVVLPHEGFAERNRELEAKLADWPRPSLATLKGTWLAQLPAGGAVQDIMIGPKSKRTVPALRKTLADKGDAYLYLGPVADLTMEERSPDLFRDADYVAELKRRHKIAQGRELDAEALLLPRPVKWIDNFSTPPTAGPGPQPVRLPFPGNTQNKDTTKRK
jgi:hypothetical protein